jgi:NADPH-dependent ferric siderophore reductase
MPPLRTRRDPPPFRRAEVERVEDLTPRLRRLTLVGPELDGLPDRGPAASLRLLVPVAEGLVLPTWNGNVWLFDDGTRAPIRTLTPRRIAGAPLELDVDVVLHGEGPISTWAAGAGPGSVAAVSGTGRGTTIDDDGAPWVLLGDESAVPAIATLLEALPPTSAVRVLVEVAQPDARLDLPAHPQAEVDWCDLPPGDPPGAALVAAAAEGPLAPGRLPPEARVFAAGEAASIQRLRRHLFDEVGHPRPRTVIRGYWKHGRAGAEEDD